MLLVDEADSILIDQASTPLIISCPQPRPPDEQGAFRWCDATSAKFAAPNATIGWTARKRSAKLTQAGCRPCFDRTQPPDRWPSLDGRVCPSRAVTGGPGVLPRGAGHRSRREGRDRRRRTGRVLPWPEVAGWAAAGDRSPGGSGVQRSDGPRPGPRRRATVEKYGHLCGMTGTATDVAEELRGVYPRGGAGGSAASALPAAGGGDAVCSRRWRPSWRR